MKLAVIGLCLLGVLAALSAAMLVNSMRASTMLVAPSGKNNEQVMVLYATRALSAMTVVDGSAVVSKPLPAGVSSIGLITNATEVVGKVLATPMVSGQAFSKSYFAEGAGSELAAALPNGKRACGISVTEYAGLGGLLYPGSMVDVLGTFKAADSPNGTRHDAVTTTLLEGVQVLAVEQQTVVSKDRLFTDPEESRHANGSRRVTLLVDSQQAKMLELAMEQGTLSLALRNPLDSMQIDKGAVALHSLTDDDSQAPPPPASTPSDDPGKMQDAVLSAIKTPGIMDYLRSVFGPAPTTRPDTGGGLFANPVENDSTPRWETTVMHGAAVEVQSFPMPPNADAKQNGS